MTIRSVLWPAALTALAIASSAIAQQRTWVVDWFGRGDFTDVNPAIAAAASGDVIEVRFPGSRNRYSDVVASKGVSLVAATDGWFFPAHVSVADLPAGETFRISGLQGAYDLRLHRCAGTVHLDGVAGGGAVNGGLLEIFDCRLVTLNNCWVVDMIVRDSAVAMTHTAVDGSADPYPYGLVAYPALRMTNSDVTATDCAFRGAHAAPSGPWPAVPGIEMQGGTLRLAENGDFARGWVQGGHVHRGPRWVILSPAIQSDGGVVVVDPDMVIPRYDGAAFSGTSQVITEEIPFVALQHVYPGYPLDCSVATCPILDGPPGASACILVSLPSPPLASPFGDFWLHPLSSILVGCGTIDASGELRGTIDFRSVLRPGDATTWQGVVLEANGRLQLTHPVVPVLGLY